MGLFGGGNNESKPESELTPEQEAQLAEWVRKAQKRPSKITHAQKQKWGWTEDTVEDQSKKDEKDNPSKK